MQHSLSHPVIVKIKKKGYALSIVVFEISRHSKTHLVFASFQNFLKSFSTVQNRKTKCHCDYLLNKRKPKIEKEKSGKTQQLYSYSKARVKCETISVTAEA